MSRRSGWGAGKIVALILAAIVGACIVLGIVFRKELAVIWGDFTRYIERVEEEVPDEDEGYTPSDDANVGNIGDYAGVIVEPGESYILTDSIAFLASDLNLTETGEFEPVSVDLSATVYPYGVSQEVNWSLEFVNPNSDWATGKTVTDYMTIEAKYEGASTATLTCKYPFGEQIKIVCTSPEDETIKDECTVDITKRFKSVSASIGDVPLNLGGVTDVTIELYRYADYTPGGKLTTNIEYYPYTLGADFSLVSNYVYVGEYFNEEQQALSWGLNSSTDGYLVIDGVDYHLADAYDDGNLYFGWNLFTKMNTVNGGGLNTMPSWAGDYEAAIQAFENIENGYLCSAVIKICTYDYDSETQVETVYDSYKTIINIAGYTYTPKIEGVELEGEGVVI